MKSCRIVVVSIVALVGLAVPPVRSAQTFEDERLFMRIEDSDRVELATARQGPWTAVQTGDTFAEYAVLSLPTESAEFAYTVLESENDRSGQLVFVSREGIAARINKVFGKVGRQTSPTVPDRPPEYWQRVFEAEDDVLGKQYLADPADPSYQRTRNQLLPLMYPESYVGMKEYPHEVHVAWDGSVGVDNGFFAGLEGGRYASAMPFALNKKEITRPESLQLLRGQLEHFLPVAHYVYQRREEQAGWEQIILMGTVRGKPGLFLRFRLVNFSAQAGCVEFAVHAPAGGKLEPKPDGTVTVTAPFATTRLPVTPPAKTFSVPMVCDLPFEVEQSSPVWRFDLPAGGHQDLYLFLPGHQPSGPLVLKPEEVRDAFYRALFGQYKSWNEFFDRGVRFTIPEPMVNEIYKGSLAKVMVSVDGDEPRGGAVHYEGFWAFCCIYPSQVLLETGYFDEARRYLQHFINTRIEPTGRFRMGANFQIFDMGDFLHLLADYYWYTGDASLITENLEPIHRVIGYLKGIRQKSIDKFPPDDPRHGLVEGIMNNDWSRVGSDYYFTNDAPVWEGLRELAQAFQDVGAAENDKELTRQGRQLAEYAQEYHQSLRRSFQTAIEWDGDKITYIHIRPVPEDAREKMRHESLRNMRFRSHRRFHEWPRFIGTDFLTDQERAFFLDYEFDHEQTVLGVRRYIPRTLDNFQIYNSAFQKLRLGRARDFLMEYFGHICFQMSPGMWSGFEQTQLQAVGEEPGRRTGTGQYFEHARLSGWEGAHATWPIPRLTRQIFAFDEPGGAAVWIGRGIPRHWHVDGQTVSAEAIPTRYGKLDLRFRYDSDVRTLHVRVDPIERRVIPELLIGCRDPESGRAVSARCEPLATECRLDSQRQLVAVSDVREPVSVSIQFQSAPAN